MEKLTNEEVIATAAQYTPALDKATLAKEMRLVLGVLDLIGHRKGSVICAAYLATHNPEVLGEFESAASIVDLAVNAPNSQYGRYFPNTARGDLLARLKIDASRLDDTKPETDEESEG